jgi:hypothetical protein
MAQIDQLQNVFSSPSQNLPPHPVERAEVEKVVPALGDGG